MKKKYKEYEILNITVYQKFSLGQRVRFFMKIVYNLFRGHSYC